MTKKIAIIGAGNMGYALAVGLTKAGITAKNNIILSDKDKKKLAFCETEKFSVSTDNKKAVTMADIVFLAVKPHLVKDVLKDIQPVLKADRHILVSVAAKTTIDDIYSVIGNTLSVFIAIPNTAIALGESVTAISTRVKDKQIRSLVEKIFSSVGIAFMVEESLLGAFVVLGSCGTAFAMRFIRALMLAGIEAGITPEMGKRVAAQVIKGAANIILQSNGDPEKEIDKVATPKGITISGLNEMEHQGFSAAVIKGVHTALKKA